MKKNIDDIIKLKEKSITLLQELKETQRIENYKYIVREINVNFSILTVDGVEKLRDKHYRVIRWLKIRNITNYTVTKL